VQQDADVTQALRFASKQFFVINDTRVFDADGAPLGEGERIIINGAAVQMMSATRQHISVTTAAPTARREATVEVADEAAPQQDMTRAA
jgi:hypothetical protein